jgi:3-deoxy-D-manno-octulosonic-acid transferase
LARLLLEGFTLAFAQSLAEGERFRELGAPRVLTVGNLKYAADPLPADDAALHALKVAMGDRPRWLAASTHAGEDEAVIAAHPALARQHPGLLTIIVPRHPARGDEIARLAAAAGLSLARRSTGVTPDGTTALYLADTMGELGLFYRLCPVVFMGGSLVPHGGQNLLEAARHGAAILHGPHMHNFAEIVAEMADATELVADGAALGQAVGRLLMDAPHAAWRGAKARAVAEAERGVLDRVIAELSPMLARLGTERAP